MVRVKIRVRFGVYLLRLVHFYQAYCTLVVRNCYITGGVLISLQISRSTGISIATAKKAFRAVMSKAAGCMQPNLGFRFSKSGYTGLPDIF